MFKREAINYLCPLTTRWSIVLLVHVETHGENTKVVKSMPATLFDSLASNLHVLLVFRGDANDKIIAIIQMGLQANDNEISEAQLHFGKHRS